LIFFLPIFAKFLIIRYGEVVDINLIRDKKTGKSKGFAFLAYENQKSTILAVDNLNGSKVIYLKKSGVYSKFEKVALFC
jgi:RNA recognition motif-containing protein